jgi:transcriptional regulator with XRE-family HTH domain
MKARKEKATTVDCFVGKRIQELRLFRGMSRQQLAAMIGVTHQQTQKYEKGVNRITVGRLIKIAEALRTPVTYFIDGVNDNDAGEPTLPTHHQRMCIEVSRNFMRINNAEYQTAVNALVRSLAAE